MSKHKTVWKIVITHEDMDGTVEQTAEIFYNLLSEVIEENLSVDFDIECIGQSSID